MSRFFFRRDSDRPVHWAVSAAPVPYLWAEAFMKDRAARIAAGDAGELVWLLEHPPLYTAGTSAKPADLIDPERFPVFTTGRGGQYTYHGPGQRIAYLMLDLKARKPDVRAFVCTLEDWLIAALARLGVRGERREGRVGIWVERPGGGEDKIAALGIRVHKWVSYHGISLNVSPDLTHFGGIVPCGIAEHGVTSLKALGQKADLAAADAALKASFIDYFGAVAETGAPDFTRNEP